MDASLLATKMDNIFLDGRKIFANLPRYSKDEVKKNRSDGFLAGKSSS